MAKRRTSPLKLVVIFVLIASTAMILIYWFELYSPKFARYPAFGIDLPLNYPIHGIDVSHHQSYIDWEEVKAMQVQNVRLEFCFIKATEGVNRVDDKFKRNWRKAKDAGLCRGAYHFFDPTASGADQAGNFIATVSLATNDLPPVLDIETIRGVSKKDMQTRIQQWLDIVERNYHVRPVIYTNAGFYKDYLAGTFDIYPLWVAHYFAKGKPRVDRDWSFWQHSESGNVNGIKSHVDFNVFCGDSTDFRKLLVQ